MQKRALKFQSKGPMMVNLIYHSVATQGCNKNKIKLRINDSEELGEKIIHFV